MATVDVTAITRDGVALTYSSASSGGDKVKAGDGTILLVKNGSSSVELTVTIAGVGKTVYGVDLPDKTFTVATSKDMGIPLLSAYGDPDDSGLASITWSATTTVTFAAMRT